MNYIVRNPKFNPDDNRAFEIYSNSACEYLENTCNYYNMLKIVNKNISLLASDGLISFRQGWKMRDNYVMYNEYVELYEKYGAVTKSQRK